MVAVIAAGLATPAAAAPAGGALTVPKAVVQVGHPSSITAAAWTPDGRFVLTGAGDAHILVWDMAGRIVDRHRLELPPGSRGLLASVSSIRIDGDRATAVVPYYATDFDHPAAFAFTWNLRTGAVAAPVAAPVPPRLLGLSAADRALELGFSPQLKVAVAAPDNAREFVVRDRDGVPVVRPRGRETPAVALLGQAGQTDAGLDFIAGNSTAADSTPGTAAVLERTMAQSGNGVAAGAPPFAVAPNGRAGGFVDILPGFKGNFVTLDSVARLIDFERGDYRPAITLPVDIDRLQWIDAATLVGTAAGGNGADSRAVRPQFIDARTMTIVRVADPMCFAAPLGHDGSLAGAGVGNCEPPGCYPDPDGPANEGVDEKGSAACAADLARGPAQGLWVFGPRGRRAFDTTRFAAAARPEILDRMIVGIEHDNWTARFTTLAASPRGDRVAALHVGAGKAVMGLWDAASGKLLVTLPDRRPLMFSGNGRRLLTLTAGVVEVRNAADGALLKAMPKIAAEVDGAAIDASGTMVAVHDDARQVRVYDALTGAPLSSPLDLMLFSDFGFDPARPVLWAMRSDRSLKAWSTRDWRELFTYRNLPGGRFVIATPTGRYDSNLAADARELRWVMPDAPLQSLGAQTFMRNLYEPRLMKRLLDCAGQADAPQCAALFTPVTGLAALNRLQPVVAVTSVVAGPGGTARVTVGASEGVDPSGQRSGLYDLRLFRDGRLVRQFPDPGVTPDAGDLAAWRAATALTPRTVSFDVPLASDGKPASFTAYAFNSDRVKGETARLDFDPSRNAVPLRPRRAIVVAVGVDWTADAAWRLNYAAGDARLIASALAAIPDRVTVPVVLVHDDRTRQATRANLRAVLLALAGKAGAAERATLAAAGIDLSRTGPVTPDDLVVVSFSGHGETREGGRFLLLPGDAVRDPATGEAAPGSMVSTDDLTAWLRPLDAGEIVLIIDACHSAASVDPGGFKPGPMGDPGLGQLAFDKGIRILAASQADGVAVEDGALGHGLLTYALAQEGLVRGLADTDRDGKVTLGEALGYAAGRMPGLAAEIRAKRLALLGVPGASVTPDARRGAVWFADGSTVPVRVQQPQLFDFTGTPGDLQLRAGTRR